MMDAMPFNQVIWLPYYIVTLGLYCKIKLNNNHTKAQFTTLSSIMYCSMELCMYMAKFTTLIKLLLSLSITSLLVILLK